MPNAEAIIEELRAALASRETMYKELLDQR
jgi:hypothetical protein